MGLLPTAGGLYLDRSLNYSKVSQAEIYSPGNSPCDAPWIPINYLAAAQGEASVSPMVLGWFNSGNRVDLLTTPGDHPTVIPVGNQLGAFIVDTGAGVRSERQRRRPGRLLRRARQPPLHEHLGHGG